MKRRTVLSTILCLIVGRESVAVVVLDLEVKDSSLFCQVLCTLQVSNVPGETTPVKENAYLSDRSQTNDSQSKT